MHEPPLPVGRPLEALTGPVYASRASPRGRDLDACPEASCFLARGLVTPALGRPPLSSA